MEKIKLSFLNAWRGVKYSFRNERNFRIEVAVGILILALAFLLQIKIWELVLIVLLIFWVLIVELINTVVERIIDIIKPKIHPYARLVKDIMAAVVLISAMMAVIVGLIIFAPYLLVVLF